MAALESVGVLAIAGEDTLPVVGMLGVGDVGEFTEIRVSDKRIGVIASKDSNFKYKALCASTPRFAKVSVWSLSSIHPTKSSTSKILDALVCFSGLVEVTGQQRKAVALVGEP